MITDFKGFGPVHLLTLLASVIIGVVFILLGKHAKTERQRRTLGLLFAITIIVCRGARYVMDAYFGVFEWYDLFSLHICHIDLILLSVCLIKPFKPLFNFCFLIGIPAALSVALFPGSNHPAPGEPRAILFIMSHALLIMGALYLLIVDKMKPTFKAYLWIAGLGNVALAAVYFVNRALDTNFLYIMEAPSGTVIATLDGMFGWPGYVFVIDALALIMMFVMYIIGRLLHKALIRKDKAFENRA
ncbi:MAG TPA: TIGR02206 family membrane protein [Oscillospiraceae bacterium]|nr:TIGR02206 family membrane protein [Oscillospiraceae bacterium]HPF56056.1 TIGR02206 family membrane protein [Clostridiales bacterium]HPK36148.1 TIGR02206 family membrane protein [Oscillospiraceae bacterium]HPR75677.1 TIGR02206 family membrane protein [Oscillospiraceae bacterium]